MPNVDKLIIFDCDGVLVDSEPLSCSVVAGQMEELGIAMTTEEAIHHFAGGSLKRVRDFVLAQTGKEAPDDFEEVYRNRSYALFKESLQPVTGIKEVLENLPNRKCVASNGPLPKMELNLGLTGLAHFFDGNLFSAYTVGHWKPHPGLFLHAAQQMGFEAQNCIVVEDSHHGVAAAIAAGMQVFGYAGRTPFQKLEQAGASVFTEMNQLPGLLN